MEAYYYVVIAGKEKLFWGMPITVALLMHGITIR
jgi:hypothetical protein